MLGHGQVRVLRSHHPGTGWLFIALLKAWFCNENCYHEALGLDED